MNIDGRVGLSAIMTAGFTAFVIISLGYAPDARLAPLVVGIPGLVLCIIQLFIDVRAAGAMRSPPVQDGTWRRAAQLMGWFGLFTLSCILFGIPFTALVPVFAFLKFDQKESLRLSLGLSAGFALALYVVFEVVLGFSLFGGIALTWFKF